MHHIVPARAVTQLITGATRVLTKGEGQPTEDSSLEIVFRKAPKLRANCGEGRPVQSHLCGECLDEIEERDREDQDAMWSCFDDAAHARSTWSL